MRLSALFDRLSFLSLGTLAALSGFIWLPVFPTPIHDYLHLLLAVYFVSRFCYHIVTGQTTLELSKPSLLMPLLLVGFLPGFRFRPSLGELVNFLGAIVFGYVVLLHFQTTRSPKRVLNLLIGGFLAALVINSAYVFLTTAGFVAPVRPPTGVPHPQITLERWAVVGFFRGVVHASMLLGIGATISIAYVASARRLVIRRLAGVAAIVLTVHLFYVFFTFGHGRTGFVYLIVLVPLLLVYLNGYQQFGRLFLLASVLVPAIGYGASFVFVRLFPFESIFDLYVAVGEFTSGRLLLYDASVSIVLSQPFGLGFGEFPSGYQTPIWYPGWMFKEIPSGPHSFLLTIATEAGVIAAAIVLYWFTTVFRAVADAIATPTVVGEFPSGVAVTTIVLVTYIGGVGPFVMYEGLIWWLCFTGALTLGRRRGSADPASRPRPGASGHNRHGTAE
ncbi:O-antigen ligase family protein [Halomicrobium katesii]|uniref:O-antigen ligase family protein n=1 Tax=Halomicrobium katesii TaxID=437163 RepID=UPI00036D88FF|nr:O-antigen ligase family protein [Halomicrobium katesii]